MTRPPKQIEITTAVRGSFVGAHGRVSYELEAGAAFEKDIDPEVLDRLLASGVAARRAPKPAQSEESA